MPCFADGGKQSYVLTNKITNGSHNPSKRCREEQAVTAFLWFGFAAWAGSLVLSALSSRGSTGGLRRGRYFTTLALPYRRVAEISPHMYPVQY